MICHDNLKAAEEMGIDRTYALSCRKRYLTRVLWELEDEQEAVGEQCPFEAGCDWWCSWDCQMGMAISLYSKFAAKKRAVERELSTIDKLALRREKEGGLTDEMIEQAREYPVDRLVDFHRGTAAAWCHDDRHPSMYHATRKNLAVCPVCDKKFNPIDILMYRDGYSFAEAVKQLS